MCYCVSYLCVVQLVILVDNPMWITSLLLILKLLCPYHDQVCLCAGMHLVCLRVCVCLFSIRSFVFSCIINLFLFCMCAEVKSSIISKRKPAAAKGVSDLDLYLYSWYICCHGFSSSCSSSTISVYNCCKHFLPKFYFTFSIIFLPLVKHKDHKHSGDYSQ